MLSDLLQVATLEQQVAHLERQRQQEAASLRGSAEHMQREMQDHCTNLQAQLDAFQVPFTAASCRWLLLLPCTAAFQVPYTAALSLLHVPFACHCCPSHAFQALHCLQSLQQITITSMFSPHKAAVANLDAPIKPANILTQLLLVLQCS